MMTLYTVTEVVIVTPVQVFVTAVVVVMLTVDTPVT